MRLARPSYMTNMPVHKLLAFTLTSVVTAACATSPPVDGGGGGGGGGKTDDPVDRCPVDGDTADIREAIEQAGYCSNAVNIAKACAFGSSIDAQFVGAAIGVCSQSFDDMPASVDADYLALLERCDAKYQNEEGTISIAAFCQLEVASMFNSFYPEHETSEPTVSYIAVCPVEDAQEAIEWAIVRAESCGEAADVAKECAWGSNIDVRFTMLAGEACAVPMMTEADRALHGKLVDLCGPQDSPVHRSLIAYCALAVDVVFNRLYAPVDGGS